MKKILIVNNNMLVGGVQKSLCNLLWEIESRYEVTLLLFRATGPYMDQIPSSVRVIESQSLFRYLGIGQAQCKTRKDKCLRGMLVGMTRLFGRSKVMPLLVKSQEPLDDGYDCAISFLHNGRRKGFYGGTQEFALHCVKARRKIAFLHCDYGRCGADDPDNNRLIGQFDTIAACSEGCRKAFLGVLPQLADKCVTVRNCHRYDRIREQAFSDPVTYPSGTNLLIVARLSHEKAIDRAITAVARGREAGRDLKLHIVGGGNMKNMLEEKARQLGVSQWVHFYGQTDNPYRYMTNADLLLVTSYHEAAPMVIEEAAATGLPVLTVETTSSRDMVLDTGIGWVCENQQQALEDTLMELTADPRMLRQRKDELKSFTFDNHLALDQFDIIITGRGMQADCMD